MLDYLGKILFPDDVEVLEIVPQHRYVYPIFKNGSTSLRKSSYLAVSNQELKNLTNIEVFVRNPHDRFLSGVQTYINKLGHEYDSQTVLNLILQNLYINRHFCPQLYWILNLSRFTSASLTIRPCEELSSITEYTENQSTSDPIIAEFFKTNSKVLFYNEMDEVLTINLIGKTVTVDEILFTLRENYSELYDDIFKTAKEVLNALPKT
jgi:hypothetical protein